MAAMRWPHKYWIDANKAMTAFVVLGLIAAYDEWSNTLAWVYLGLHGTYGFLWLLKSRVYPDRSWERPVSLSFGLFTWLSLAAYWVAPWLIVSGNAGDTPGWLVGVCVALCIGGVMLHFAADMQKHMWLRFNPGTLLTDGLWSRTRNPNYLGELMIYLSFVLLPLHWLPPLALAGVFFGYWLPNMKRKDASLSRYPEFSAYAAGSGLLLPSLRRRRPQEPPGEAPPREADFSVTTSR